MQRALIIVGALLLVAGCTTVGNFKIPEGTQLEVYERPVALEEDGSVKTKPFFWTAVGSPPRGGVKYRLLKGTEVVEEGRVQTKFRPVSIFWPPGAFIYWPLGFVPETTYDLTPKVQE